MNCHWMLGAQKPSQRPMPLLGQAVGSCAVGTLPVTDGWKNWVEERLQPGGRGGQNGLGPTKLQSQVKGEQGERSKGSSEPRLFQTHTYPPCVKPSSMLSTGKTSASPLQTSKKDALRLRCVRNRHFYQISPGSNLVLGLLRKHRQKEAWRSLHHWKDHKHLGSPTLQTRPEDGT